MSATIRDRFDGLRAQFRPSSPVEKATDPPHVTVPASLVRSAKLAAWIAFFALVYFLWLYTLDIAKDRAASLHLTKVGQWTGDIQFWFPYIAGFAAVSVGIPYVAKIAIPVFMSLTWKENLWPKAWALFIAFAVSLVVLAGTFTIQGGAIVEKGRDLAVREQTRSDAIATLERQKQNATAELEAMTSTAMGSRFQAQAARAGVEGWKATIAEAERQRDPMLPQIRRAIGSAASADAIRQRIRDLDDKIGAAPTQASVAARVETRSTGWIQNTLDWLEGARAILLSLVMDIVCLLMPWIAQRLEQARNRQLAGIADSIVRPQGTAWADDAHMVEDLRAEPAVKARGMAPGKSKVYDAETGEELEHITPSAYYRKRPKKKGDPVPMDLGPRDPAPDDKGVVLQSDSRAARSGVDEKDGSGEDRSGDAGVFERHGNGNGGDSLPVDASVGVGSGAADFDGDAVANAADGVGDDDIRSGVDGEDSFLILDATEEELAALDSGEALDFEATDTGVVISDVPFGPPAPRGLGYEGRDGVMREDAA